MELATQTSPLAALGTMIGWLVVALVVVFTMLAILRLIDAKDRAFSDRDRRRRR